MFWRLAKRETDDGFRGKTCAKEAIKKEFLFFQKRKKNFQMNQISNVDETEYTFFRKECFPV